MIALAALRTTDDFNACANMNSIEMLVNCGLCADDTLFITRPEK
jgi:hypothetical protein